jgi:hypothetical protein
MPTLIATLVRRDGARPLVRGDPRSFDDHVAGIPESWRVDARGDLSFVSAELAEEVGDAR